MARAIALAAPQHPHPNPRVGAVLLDATDHIIGEGAHVGPGQAHAETVALSRLSPGAATGATLVVTLEPCDHHGRTPPCTEAIIAAGIRRVVIGAVDPDPGVSGRGVQRLREAGVEVEVGLMTGEVEALDPGYFHHRRRGRALTLVKIAMTLDGQIAPRDGVSRWITGEPARTDAHRLRAGADAVMVGAGTLRTDDPRLDVRLDDHRGPQPRPVVVKGLADLPAQAAIWERDPLIVAAAPVAGRDTIVVPADRDGKPQLEPALIELGERGILTVVVEGGATLLRSLWVEGLVDRGISYVAARIAGGAGLGMFAGEWTALVEARPVQIETITRLGPDLRIDWIPVGGEGGG